LKTSIFLHRLRLLRIVHVNNEVNCRSKSQPFCDGSHKPTAFRPIEFKADKSEEVWFCACKRSGKKPMCDGSHKRL